MLNFFQREHLNGWILKVLSGIDLPAILRKYVDLAVDLEYPKELRELQIAYVSASDEKAIKQILLN